MLRLFAHPVACCWMLLRKVWNQSNFGSQQLPTFLLFRDRRSVAQQCWIHLHSSSNIVGAAHALYAWLTKTYGLYPSIRSHTTANTHATTPNIVGSTMLGVVESVCTQRQRRNWICPCVYVLQTKAEKEIYDRVRTGCKEKRTGPAKCCFSFTYWAHCRHRRLRRCSQDLSMCVNGQESEHVFGKNACHLFTRYICYSRFGPFFVSLETEISVLWKKKTLFLWKPKFGWRGKKSPLF